MKKTFWTMFTALMVALAVLISPALPTHAVQAAGPFTVNTTADSHDAMLGNGVCADAGGVCSLRAAIEEANANPTPTTINLPAGTYNLTLGALDVAPNGGRTITITGAGPASTVINQMNSSYRVMAIDYNIAGNTIVTLSGVTLSGGGDASDHWGGAGILAGSWDAAPDRLTLSNCIIQNNHVSPLNVDQSGGGVRMDGGILTVTNCTFSNNSSGTAAGGAIAFIGTFFQDTVNISGSTFANNTSANTTTSGPVGGGAIFINNAVATISNSTFNANQATSSASGGAHGGAVYFNTGTLTIDHSTFTGNAASGTYGRGGAIYLDHGALSLTYSRIFGNLASSGGSGVFNNALNGATTTATNDWWGCNGGSGAAGCDQAVTNNAGLTVSPWIVLTNTASPATLHPGGSATLTASFRQNSNGQALTAADVSVLQAKPLSWTNVVNGTLTNPQNTVGAEGQATATFTAGSTLGTGGASAQFDNAVVQATLTVQKTAAVVSVTADTNPSVFGQTVTFTAMVTSSAGTPTGAVQFNIDGNPTGGPVSLADGVATFTTDLLPTGTHAITANYAGDANFTPASGTLADGQMVDRADTTTTLTATLGGGLFRPELLLEAVIVPVAPGGGVPTGTVTFSGDLLSDTAVPLDASGRASIVVPNVAPGSYSFTATYNGNVNFKGSNHAIGLIVPHIVALPLICR